MIPKGKKHMLLLLNEDIANEFRKKCRDEGFKYSSKIEIMMKDFIGS